MEFVVEEVECEVSWAEFSFGEVRREFGAFKPSILRDHGDLDVFVEFVGAVDLFHITAEVGGVADDAVPLAVSVFVVGVIREWHAGDEFQEISARHLVEGGVGVGITAVFPCVVCNLNAFRHFEVVGVGYHLADDFLEWVVCEKFLR